MDLLCIFSETISPPQNENHSTNGQRQHFRGKWGKSTFYNERTFMLFFGENWPASPTEVFQGFPYCSAYMHTYCSYVTCKCIFVHMSIWTVYSISVWSFWRLPCRTEEL
jgi:hypothetical protein